MVVKYFKCPARFYISINRCNVKSIRLIERMEFEQVQVSFQCSELAHRVAFFLSESPFEQAWSRRLSFYVLLAEYSCFATNNN